MKTLTLLPSIRDSAAKPLHIRPDGTVIRISLRKPPSLIRFAKALHVIKVFFSAPIP